VRRIIALAAISISIVLVTACGGSGDNVNGVGGNTIATAGSNVAAVVVNAGPTVNGQSVGDVNLLFTSVTICTPGSTTACQTINNIQVDTQSYGLRIIASALSSAVTLPAETNAANYPLAECTQFADGYTWGSLHTVDLTIAQEKAAGIPIQVIGDPAYPSVPADCASTGAQEDTVETFGANGILGIGPFDQDCGTCTTGTQTGHYYVCPTASTCADATVLLAQEVSNPVYEFSTDNNGVIIELPVVPAGGSATVSGALVFGIDTQQNNVFQNATPLYADENGDVTALYKSASLADSLFDTGSNANFVPDTTIPTCSDNPFLCPSSTLTTTVTMEDPTGTVSALTLNIANADTLFNGNPTFTAFSNLGSQNSDTTALVWGLPFFYGRNVYVAFDGRTNTVGTGPFYAY
jgi:hypothetical protein